MDTFEIKDDEIDVEEIMRKIRENIKKRRESGAYSQEMEDMINEPFQAPAAIPGRDELQQNLDYLDSNWDVHAEYHISSHRPVLGRFLVWARRMIHNEVRRFVDLIAGKQSEFNAHVVRSVKSLDNRIKEAVANINKDIDTKITDLDKDVDTKITDLDKDVDTRLNKAVAAEVNDAVAAVNKDIENKVWLANILEKRIKTNMMASLPEKTDDVMNYFVFEEKFRGSTEDIKQRQSVYLEYFKNCQNVLDIGCGRGEFLSLLKENGIGAKGIDINEDMVLYCQKEGLEVLEVEALSYLQSLEDKSLDGVFSAQVVEHLKPEQLISLVKLSYEKMMYGKYFVAETINPLCLSVFAESFYMDLSHVRPIHPDTLKFLMESVGFQDIGVKFFSPYSEAERLRRLEITDSMDGEEKTQLEVLNQNIDKLNSLLYGYQDFAVIGKK